MNEVSKCAEIICSSFDNLYFPLEDLNFEICVPKATVRKLLLSTIVMDARSRFIDRTEHKYEQQSAHSGEYRVVVYGGETWSPGNRAWGYAYTYYIVKRSTRPSVTDAFSRQAHNAGSEKFTQSEIFVGSRSDSTSKRATIGDFRCWTTAWGQDSVCYIYIWRAQTKIMDLDWALSNFLELETQKR